MPWRYQEALNSALRDLQSRPGAVGILFFGSALTGTAGPTSDLDLYVVLEDDSLEPKISLCRYEGVETEVHLAPARFWRDRITGGNAIIVGAFATGQPLLDPTGLMAELCDLARAKAAEGPTALTPVEIDRWRYRLTDLAGDLEDVAGQLANERMLGAQLVTLALQAFCELNRLWSEKPKRLIDYVEKVDAELGRMVRTFFTEDLDRHLAKSIVDRVLAPHGGPMGAWETPDGEI